MKKVYESAAEAVADVEDGAVIMFGGFGSAGSPTNLILALVERVPKTSPPSPTTSASAKA
jgi:acyl CoA:acetate/3-ketoacid CoA transferase alpha subunit